MPELKKDELVAVVKEDKVEVTRNIVEEYNFEEYLNAVMKFGMNIDRLKEQQVEQESMVGTFGSVKEEVDKLVKESKEKKDGKDSTSINK